MNIKKIVAREGLIVIVFVVVTGGIFFLDSVLPRISSEYVTSVELSGHKHEIIWEDECTATSDINDEDKYNILKTLIEKFPNEFSKIDKPDIYRTDFKIGECESGYSVLGHLRNLLSDLRFLIPFVFYPFYWVIRFIIWATRTLKSKE